MWLYVSLVLILILYYLFKSYNYDYWEKREVPTASGNEWFFGHSRPLILVKKHMNEFFEEMYKEFPDAPLVGYYMMNVPSLMVKDLDMIKSILISEFSSFNYNGIVLDKKTDVLAATHPFVLQGEEWKASRAQVNPSLSLNKLRGYLHNMQKVADVMVNHVKKNSKSSNGIVEVDVRNLALTYSTDVIGNAIYGVENNAFDNKDSLMTRLTREIHSKKYVSDNIKLIFFQRLPIIKWFFPPGFTSKQLQEVMVALTSKVVKERIATGEKRNDLIQLLLAQKENDTEGIYTDEYISGQVFVLIIDMYETASNYISFLLTTISKHPEIQEKVREEIKSIKSKVNGEFTIEDIEGAKYMDMVFNETLRLFSFFIPRQCTNDCYIPVPGSKPFKITKGTPVAIPTSCIHKDPKYYPDPEKFDPERFTEEEVAKRPKFTFMPFGEGPKKCIGNRIGTLHMKVALIKILDNFKLTLSPKTKYPIDVEPHYTVTVRPRNNLWVDFEPINN